MVSAFTLLAAGSALTGVSQDSAPQETSYMCWRVRGDGDEVDESRPADLRMVRHGQSETAQWTLAWPGRPDITATGFPAEFGSVGGSQGLRWQENGADKTAYISFSDLQLANGATALWMSMDRPSLWQGRGIICRSQPSRTEISQ
jgi:hypothetical protein